jgi:hypothetical protein
MTSCRLLLTFASLALFAACAVAPPPNTAIEQLDPETGTTITRLLRPIEFNVTAGRGPAGDPFAYLGVFQTNRMGTRNEYLWIALPVEAALTSMPVVELDGAALELPPPTNNPDVAGLKSSPYSIPAPWSQPHFYPLASGVADRLATATQLAIRSTDGGGAWTFVANPDAPAALGSYLELR